jgi:hypothetical protein
LRASGLLRHTAVLRASRNSICHTGGRLRASDSSQRLLFCVLQGYCGILPFCVLQEIVSVIQGQAPRLRQFSKVIVLRASRLLLRRTPSASLVGTLPLRLRTLPLHVFAFHFFSFFISFFYFIFCTFTLCLFLYRICIK